VPVTFRAQTADRTPGPHWRRRSPGIFRRAVCYKLTDVSEVLTAAIIAYITDLRNVVRFLADHTAKHFWWQQSSFRWLWESWNLSYGL